MQEASDSFDFGGGTGPYDPVFVPYAFKSLVSQGDQDRGELEKSAIGQRCECRSSARCVWCLFEL